MRFPFLKDPNFDQPKVVPKFEPRPNPNPTQAQPNLTQPQPNLSLD